MPTKFSQFNAGGALTAGDIVVGLRNQQNTKFNASAFPVESWMVITTNQILQPNAGYFANGGITLILQLPAVFAVGQVIEVAAMNSVGFDLVLQAGQSIVFGDVIANTGISNTRRGDAIKLVGQVANTTWQTTSCMGDLTYV